MSEIYPVARPAPVGFPPKNIVICCDGTGNEFGDTNSNVIKLYTTLNLDNEDEQVAYYHPGVGTMGDPAEKYWILRKWSALKGLAFAAGFKNNIFDAYTYLMSVYNEGDRVYLFGFSRGSYTVRALAGLLDGYGLLQRGNEGHLPYAWRLYAKQHKDRTRHSMHPLDHEALAFKQTFSHKHFTLHFVGVWDTVSSVGWVNTPVRLFNVGQNEIIETGRHAVSIDERRCFYEDNLWGLPIKGTTQDIVQVWFAGVHSDVGGSYAQNESAPSNITLEWMLGEAKAAGLKTDAGKEALVFGKVTDPPYAAAHLYKAPDPWHELHHSLRWLWLLLEILPHIYYDKDDGVEHYRIPLGRRRQLPSHSLLHPSVIERMRGVPGEPAYNPKNLKPKNAQTGHIVELLDNPFVTKADLRGFFLYTLPKKHNSKLQKKLNLIGRWAVILLFVLAESLLALCVLLLVVKGALHIAGWHLPARGACWTAREYHCFGVWVLRHLGDKVGAFFF